MGAGIEETRWEFRDVEKHQASCFWRLFLFVTPAVNLEGSGILSC